MELLKRLGAATAVAVLALAIVGGLRMACRARESDKAQRQLQRQWHGKQQLHMMHYSAGYNGVEGGAEEYYGTGGELGGAPGWPGCYDGRYVPRTDHYSTPTHQHLMARGMAGGAGGAGGIMAGGGMPLSLPRSLPGSLRELTRRGVGYQTISVSDAAEECLSHFSIEPDDEDEEQEGAELQVQPALLVGGRRTGGELAVVHDHTGRGGADGGPQAGFIHF